MTVECLYRVKVSVFLERREEECGLSENGGVLELADIQTTDVNWRNEAI